MSEEELNEQYIKNKIQGICQDCMWFDKTIPIINKMLSEAYISGFEQGKFDSKMDLQQKVEQLEKEVNKYQKELEKADSITQSCIFQGKQKSKISFRNCLNRLEQLENIRKEAIEYIKNDSYFDGSSMCTNDLLNILNKGDNNGK